MTRRAIATGLVVICMALSHIPPADAQGLSADVSAGRLMYDPLVADIGTNNLTGSLRYDSRRDSWVYGAAATPFGDAGTLWGAAGAGGRVTFATSHAGRVAYGTDLGAHGFWFKDRVADEGGTGGSLDAMPFARVSAGGAFVEGRGGWRGQTLSFIGVRDSRGVFETGARAGYGTALSIEGDIHWVKAVEGTYPFIGGTVGYQASRLGIWGNAGKWVSTDLDDRVWAIGSSVSLGARTSVWGTIRQEGRDPLYWNAPRKSWTIGVSHRLGRMPAPLVPVASGAGGVVVRLRGGDAPAGAVFIAGDFNNWQPAPMQREGADWVVRLSLTPGVYHYTFRTANGEWFVPASFAGRRDDGLGGYHVVLVVS